MTTNIAGLDENSRNVMKALSSVDGVSIVNLYADPVTHRLLVDTAGGAGTVTSVSIVSANGFAGTVATATTTPAITISTTITGVLKGNGTAISAATDGTDYLSSTTGVTLAQGTAQTIGTTTNRVLKLWATDITVTNAIAGSITGNASTVTTNANLTGDVTSVGNATTLATVNSNVGSFGSATQVATFTVNGKGLTTAASNVTITPAIGSITGLGTGVATALAVNIGSAGAPVLYNGAGGTPSSLTGTNITGTATGLTSGITNALKSATTTVDVSAATAPSSGQVLTATGSTTATWQTPTSGGSSFWTALAGATRVSNTTFTVTGDQTALIAKGMIIKWTESSTVRVAMVSIPSTFSSTTTVTIIGDTMTSIDSNSLKYASIGAEVFTARFAIAGTIGATGTDTANAYYATEPMRVIGADLQVGTAGTTNSTTIDINNAGTTMFTTKPTLATTVATSPTPFTADSATSLALADRVSIDIDAIQTTPAIDLYAQLYLFPTRYLNLT